MLLNHIYVILIFVKEKQNWLNCSKHVKTTMKNQKIEKCKGQDLEEHNYE